MTPLLDPILRTVNTLIDRLIPDVAGRERAKAEAQNAIVNAVNEANAQQVEINKLEAQNPNIFVSGWRPFVGWVCGVGVAWAFVLQPIATWVVSLYRTDFIAPTLPVDVLLSLLLGLLGLGGLRTMEKLQGVASASQQTNASVQVRRAQKA